MTDKDAYYSRRGCEHNAIAILVIFILSITILFSCEKVEDEYCYTCTTHFYEWKYLPDCRIWMWDYVDSIQLYGWTESDIKKYERYNTIDKHSDDIYGNYIEWQDCVCVKQEK